MSMVLTMLSPFSLFFVLFVVTDGQYVEFAIAGSLVMALVSYGLALGEDIVYYKTEYKIQDIFVASPVSPLTYMTGLALSELLFGLPAITVLSFLAVYFGTSFANIPILVSIIILIWGSMSAMGFYLSTHMRHMRNARQVISFLIVIFSVLPPVFYSIERLPMLLQYLAYLFPTTHASLMLQSIMGLDTPQGWSIGLGIVVQLAYLVGFVLLAKTRAMWREV